MSGSSSETLPSATPTEPRLFVAVDIGGTKIASALVTVEGSGLPSVSEKSEIPTPAQSGSKAVVEAVYESVRRCLDLANETPAGIGIASAGVVNTETGSITSATDLIIGWAGTPLGKLVEEEFGLPVAVLNDVHAHALGEWTYGAGKGFDSMLAVAVGTGIGGAIISDGKLHLAPTSRPVTSATFRIRLQLDLNARAALADTSNPSRPAPVRSLFTTAKRPGVRSRLRPRNHRPRRCWRSFRTADPFDSGAALGDSIAGIANCVDPQAVVLSGSVTRSGELWWNALKDAFQAGALPALRKSKYLKAPSDPRRPTAEQVTVAAQTFKQLKNKPGDHNERSSKTLLEQIKGGLVVSVQAYPGEPMRHPETMAQIALAAEQGGAVAIRCQGLADISAIRGQVEVPVIGLWKDGHEGVFITPTLRHARSCLMAGADIVALDATRRPRPDGLTYAETVAALHDEGAVVMADCGSFEDAVRAAEAGSDILSTTLAGYSGERPKTEWPRL